MARSFWKGRGFITDLIRPLYTANAVQHLRFKKLKALPSLLPDELRINRRNHILFEAQKQLISRIPFLLYNGYDYFGKLLAGHSENPYLSSFNLGAQVLTRETKVVHKVKIAKGARKTPQKQKKPVSQRNVKQKITLRSSLSKKFKK